MNLSQLAMLALIAIVAGAIIGNQAADTPAASAQVALPEPTLVNKITVLPLDPTPTESPPDPTPIVTESPTTNDHPQRRPLILPNTGDPFIWGPRAWHEEGFPERVWFTKQGRSGELAAELVVLLRGETLEFGAGLYELTGMIQVSEFDVWAAFLPSDMTLITNTGYNATTGDWKHRVVFLFQEARRNGNQN